MPQAGTSYASRHAAITYPDYGEQIYLRATAADHNLSTFTHCENISAIPCNESPQNLQLELSPPEIERLRAQIREAVIAALRRRNSLGSGNTSAAAQGKTIVSLFSGSRVPADDYFADIASLVGQGYRLLAAMSHTFSQFRAETTLARLPAGTALIEADNEVAIRDTVRSTDAVIAPHISQNSAAKIALGIEDSLPSRLVRNALLLGKPVCVWLDMPAHRQALIDESPAAPPAIIRIADDHLHTLQQMGVRFTGGNVASCITQIMRPEVNETPERLARNKPFPKREFVTAEDVWTAMSRGQKEMILSPGTIVTDEAREYAASRGITLLQH